MQLEVLLLGGDSSLKHARLVDLVGVAKLLALVRLSVVLGGFALLDRLLAHVACLARSVCVCVCVCVVQTRHTFARETAHDATTHLAAASRARHVMAALRFEIRRLCACVRTRLTPRQQRDNKRNHAAYLTTCTVDEQRLRRAFFDESAHFRFVVFLDLSVSRVFCWSRTQTLS